MENIDETQLLALATQLPVSQLGDQLLHLQPGSKLGLYLLELSNLPVSSEQVEVAEVDLSRPLNWILEGLRVESCGNCGIDLSEFEAALAHPDEEFLSFFPVQDQERIQDSLRSYFTLAVKSGMVTIAGNQVMLSLMGIRQLRSPQPVLPLMAFALSDCDNEGAFQRMIMGALAQAFAGAEWALPGEPAGVAVEFLAEMGDECDIETEARILRIFNELIYGAGCGSPTDDTAMVLLQYLVSEALQP
ncbi:MAG: hypothetical protein MSC45_04045 [Mobiluncus sp.]|uniref:hypothetical protein n=1 Tax=Mobiluncus sp. TaxID=47293 RepID=UPI00258B89D8|nr:hypothetical protein [Mobiluncus sp.]MCI6584225.1 hypothetical protein [Mobiluncus sp.]